MINAYDFKHSLNRLFADYKFTLTVIITMALGLAVSLFLFSQIYIMKYKPLPFQNGESIVSVTLSEQYYTPTYGGLRNFVVHYFAKNQSTLDNFSVYGPRSFVVSTDRYTETYFGAATSANFFSITGVDALLGRTLEPSDSVPGAAPVAVISDDVWQKLFQKDKAVIGELISINGFQHQIVGVMPKGYHFPIYQHIWTSYRKPPTNVTAPDGEGWGTVLGVLKQGVSKQQALDEFKALSAEIQRLYPTEYKGKSSILRTFPEAFSSFNNLIINIMAIVAIAILLIGCASASNLLIVRILEQSKDTMMKLAIGLPAWRVALVPVLESFWLCSLSGFLGLALCALAMKYSEQFSYTANGPFWWSMEMGMYIWFAAAAFVLSIWVVTGVIPVIMSLRTPTNSVLAGGRKGGVGAKSGPIMSILIAFQVLCVFVLIVFTGLSVFAFIKVVNADYGVNPKGFLSGYIQPGEGSYPTIKDRVSYYSKLEQELTKFTSVKSVAFTGALPGQNSYGARYNAVNRDLSENGIYPNVNEIPISTNLLSTLGIPLIEGRNFVDSDDEDADKVVIVNQKLANKVWSGQSAIGKQLQLNPEKHGPLLTVVGVVPNIIYGSPVAQGQSEEGAFYLPMKQVLHSWASMKMLAKIDDNPLEKVELFKEAARRVDAQVPINRLITLEESLDRNGYMFKVIIYNFFPAAILALIMAAISIYGISARVVIQQTNDIGIMKALGANNADVVMMYLKKSWLQLATGTAVGMVVLFLMLPQISERLVVATTESFFKISLITACVVFVIVSLASYLPIQRINKLSPQSAITQGVDL